MEKEKKKEKALDDFIEMIQDSWTYGKMTGWEKDRLQEVFNHTIIEKALKGSYAKRWQILQAIYFTYLQAIGYDNFNWREDSTDEKAPF